MTGPKWGSERNRQDVYGPTPTRETAGSNRASQAEAREERPRRPSISHAPVRRHIADHRIVPISRTVAQRKFKAPKEPVEPIEVFTPPADTDELRGQVHGLLEYVIGGAALSEAVETALQDETRRSVLIQRARGALEKSGFFDSEALIEPAQRINDLIARYDSRDGTIDPDY